MSSTSGGAASSATASGLGKAALVQQLNALCSTTFSAVKALPEPSGPTDYANIQDYVAKTLDLHGRFIAQASVLVGQSADKAELTSKFLTPDYGDFSAASPPYTELAAAAKAQNEAQVSARLGQLDVLNDHSEQIAACITSHGLTACAQLESS